MNGKYKALWLNENDKLVVLDRRVYHYHKYRRMGESYKKIMNFCKILDKISQISS